MEKGHRNSVYHTGKQVLFFLSLKISMVDVI